MLPTGHSRMDSTASCRQSKIVQGVEREVKRCSTYPHLLLHGPQGGLWKFSLKNDWAGTNLNRTKGACQGQNRVRKLWNYLCQDLPACPKHAPWSSPIPPLLVPFHQAHAPSHQWLPCTSGVSSVWQSSSGLAASSSSALKLAAAWQHVAHATISHFTATESVSAAINGSACRLSPRKDQVINLFSGIQSQYNKYMAGGGGQFP